MDDNNLLEERIKDYSWIFLILFILTFPLFLIGPYEESIISDSSKKTGKTNETVSFDIIIQRKGGVLSNKYEIRDIEFNKKWNFSISKRLIKVSPNSKEITSIFIEIPNNVKDGEYNIIHLKLFEKIIGPFGEEGFMSFSFSIEVDNDHPSQSLRKGSSSIRSTFGCRLSFILLIPIAVIIIAFKKLLKYYW